MRARTTEPDTEEAASSAQLLLGRDRELSKLYALVDGIDEQGGSLIIRGDAGIGVRDSSALTNAAYPDMPLVSSGWTDTSAFFKGEGGNINIGLGRGLALDVFNNGILSWGTVP